MIDLDWFAQELRDRDERVRNKTLHDVAAGSRNAVDALEDTTQPNVVKALRGTARAIEGMATDA